MVSNDVAREWSKFGACWRTTSGGVTVAGDCGSDSVLDAAWGDWERSEEEIKGEIDNVGKRGGGTGVGEGTGHDIDTIVRLLLLLSTFLCRFFAVSCWRKENCEDF